MPESVVKLRLVSTWSAIDWRANSGRRIRIAETTAVWWYLMLGIQGFASLPLRPINSSIED